LQIFPQTKSLATRRRSSILRREVARQPVDLTRPHPFIEAGNTEFNSFLWMPPSGARAGHILLADLTIFTTLFGGGRESRQLLVQHRDKRMSRKSRDF
jgi:hypothetical protein